MEAIKHDIHSSQSDGKHPNIFYNFGSELFTYGIINRPSSSSIYIKYIKYALTARDQNTHIFILYLSQQCNSWPVTRVQSTYIRLVFIHPCTDTSKMQSLSRTMGYKPPHFVCYDIIIYVLNAWPDSRPALITLPPLTPYKHLNCDSLCSLELLFKLLFSRLRNLEAVMWTVAVPMQN